MGLRLKVSSGVGSGLGLGTDLGLVMDFGAGAALGVRPETGKGAGPGRGSSWDLRLSWGRAWGELLFWVCGWFYDGDVGRHWCLGLG